jgi:hypothetical protein
VIAAIEDALMDAIPNLYLKWRAVREIIGLHQSDAEIAEKIFGENDGAVKFSKLLKGDYGCTPEIASEVAGVINRRLGTYRKARGAEVEGEVKLSAADIALPLYEFTQRLVKAAGDNIAPETLERAHRVLLDEMAPRIPGSESGARLRIERYSTDRLFAPFAPAGGEGPVVFEAGLHLGGLAVEGLARDPIAAYVLVIRDPAPQQHLWEMKFGETVQWLPSPFVPMRRDNRYILMDPEPVRPVPGRFLVTAVLVLDDSALGRLDPRGSTRSPTALNELETTRFITNVRRLAKRTPSPIALASSEYRVVA